MQNLLEELKATLQSDERLIIDGKLVKNKVVELALAIDEGLIYLLLSNKSIKKHFFKHIGDVLVFDKVAFQSFVSNKQFLPDSYTAFKNKIGLTANREYLTESKEVVLAWPYKDCVLEGGQTKEDQKRKEIFWNETLAPDEIDRLLAPKALTNFKKHDKSGEHKVENFSLDDNLIIKGNNLLALYSLKKQYTGKVKLIYIDPPYNTGNDSFNYNDSFNHSTWLTFIRNRLSIAKKLLTKDGVIFINVDDKEYAYLKVVCDEVFGRDNFLNVITVKTSDPSGHKTVNPSPYSQTEYILLYANFKPSYNYDIHYVSSNYDSGYNQYIINLEEGFKKWETVGLFDYLAKENGYKNTRDANKKLGKSVFLSIIAEFALNNREKVYQATAIANDAAKDIVSIRDKSAKNPGETFKVEREKENIFIKDGRQIYFYSNKVREIDGILTPSKPLTNLWTDIPYNGISKEGGVTLKNGKKPEKLLRRIIEISTSKGDLILDYHLGSGTTCAVAHKMGRRYIGIEQLHYGDNDSTIRLSNVIKGDKSGISKTIKWQGGGSFIYTELIQHNAKVIDKIEQANTTEALKSIWQEIENADFISYKIKPESINENIHEFEALSLEEQKQFLIAVLDKNQLYVNYSDIEDEHYEISDSDKKLNKQFYGEI